MNFYFVYDPHQLRVMAEVAELERIATLPSAPEIIYRCKPSLPEKTLVKAKELPISNWFWFAAFICAGVILATTYLARW